MTKSKNRILAEEIQKKTGRSLVMINYDAFQFIEMGHCSDILGALEYMLLLLEDEGK